jgi:hypothetical protein
MDNALIFQILGVLAVLFFIFITYMNTKTWHWPHVTFMFLVLPAAATAMVYSAMSLKTRAVWMTKAKALEPELETTLANIERGREGDPGDIERKESFIGLREELNRVTINRGRVWRNCQPTVNPDQSITLAFPPPPQPEPGQPAPSGKHNIEPKLVLHAFLEFEQDGIRSPRVYLGEFTVAAVAETSIALTPRLPLLPAQQAAVNQPGTWAIYEQAPIDSHAIFAGMDENALRQLIPQQETGLDNTAYAAFLKPYIRDGQDADEAADPPENIWIEVKFVRTHKVEVDAPQAIHAFDGGPFDAEGRALFHRLRNVAAGAPAEPVEFEPGQIGLFPKSQADDLINAQVAEKVRAVYRRSLVDYEAGFDHIFRRITDMNLRLRELRRDIATLEAHNASAETQAQDLEAYKGMLESDLADAKKNQGALTTYLTSLEKQVADTRNHLSGLYASNRRLHAELSQITGRLTQEIDARSRAAGAQ